VVGTVCTVGTDMHRVARTIDVCILSQTSHGQN
jgi:hypothetical protein